MNATARDPKGPGMEETIDYERRGHSDTGLELSGQEAPATESARNATGRFTYGSGSRPLEGYTIKRAIGRGGFGEVYYAVTDAGKEVALKLITRNLDVERRGVMQCMNLKSQHLITIHDLRTNDEGDTFVIMEYVSGPSLASVLQKHPSGLPLDEVRHWLRGLVEGVSYLHDHGIVHRDLKPANLFLEEGVVKIGDYGLSKAITHSKEPGHSQSVGTCHYMAPEIGTGKYHKPIDIYAMGVILYEMITGKVPFDGESVQEVLMKHLTARPDLRPLPEPYKTIVGLALAKDPNHRPARATDLLPPGEVSRAPDVRFIPENSKTATSGAPGQAVGSAAQGRVEEQPVQIGPEEPVFYIGPDTMPPRRPRLQRMAEAARRGWRQMTVARATPKRFMGRPAAAPPRPPAPPVVHRPTPRAPAPAPKPQPEPEPPPEPPAAPVGRARVAELATSMLVAAGVAVVATVFSVPAFGAVNGRPPEDPTQLAMIYAMTLLGSWGVLIPAKFWEGRALSNRCKRLTYLGVGALVGMAGAGLAQWAHLGLPGAVVDGPAREIFVTASRRVRPDLLSTLTLGTYFALAFAVNGFWKLAARDRRARVRLVPILAAALLSGLVGVVVPSPQPWGLVVMALVALVAQVSSPWSRQAAAYARYCEALGRRRVA